MGCRLAIREVIILTEGSKVNRIQGAAIRLNAAFHSEEAQALNG